MPNFTYGTTTIEYDLEYKADKRDISISVEWLNGVKVTAPQKIDESQLESVLYKKAPWILQKWNDCREIVDPPAPKEFVSGEKFSYLGRNYRLKVRKHDELKKSKLVFWQGKFLADIPASYSDEERIEELKQLFKTWYKQHGESKLKERLDMYAGKLNVAPTKFALKEQKMRWGTCTSDNVIYLNWRIVMAPVPIIDYLLVHELTHIKHPNHSRDFWNCLYSIFPDYEQRKEWLRKNGPTLTIE
ncbi:M48 family metallopeptidase [Bacillus shivajii]|uniref:M48 family metallopeptidase n=1 Tax=Bacillus shivajii TaxID=1983719 RepID=UPI001CFA1AC2|nr:SprT family zinc-dependent metalloprotease [Bacillus shivajii]UCZ53466.1 M48 family metallopeptidase [Bacillus shivajii]